MNPKIISILNKKGGVGKTTTAVNLGYSLTLPEFNNKKVLIIDLDSQYSATTWLGFDNETIEEMDEKKEGIYEVLMEYKPLQEEIRSTKYDNLDILPGMSLLDQAETELKGKFDANTRLKKSINKSEDYLNQYDFILIDCSPALGLLEYNALLVSDYIIIPVDTDELSFNGIIQMMNTIKDIQEVNTKLKILGLLFTNVDARSNFDDYYRELYEQIDPDKIFDTSINQNIDMKKALKNYQPVHSYKSSAKAAQKYMEFTDEMLNKIFPDYISKIGGEK